MSQTSIDFPYKIIIDIRNKQDFIPCSTLNMEIERNLAEIQQENRKIIPKLLRMAQVSGISKKTINAFEKELDRKTPFGDYIFNRSIYASGEKQQTREELQKLAIFFRRDDDVSKNFHYYMKHYMDVPPYSNLGLDLGYMVYYFGPGGGFFNGEIQEVSNGIEEILTHEEPDRSTHDFLI